ncbi:L-threonine dehydratase catabolic TdcB [Gracilariopsis chorda]|uniref:L-threonine dehydratase catabolic TdcB n=1 Tax=Gracilariopsis chorda TaxID=448386 RepID=A0A2V3IRZ1_9FLOR|nr:L-threonine dehydratase catabolic TdcB [Gracilariopsis chorda]|eukprot:PXF44901.1 L-threonine dehydratase catabolic TdcB [Gracilariopsis chorda]
MSSDSKPEPGVFYVCRNKNEDNTVTAGADGLIDKALWRDKESCARYFAKLSIIAHETLQNLRRSNASAVLWTPMLRALSLGPSVFIKLESEQITNSFKVRGAINCVKHASGKQIVTASTGNHALAVAHAVQLLGKQGTIFLPTNVAEGKLAALKQATITANCELWILGNDCLQAEIAASEHAAANNAVYVSPYNDEHVIAGQGTIGIEILDYFSRSYPSFSGSRKCCYITVGGGGLISGIAAVLKANQPDEWRIIGCLPQNSPVMYDCVKAGCVVDSNCAETLSDGSAGSIEENTITFEACSCLVDAWAIVAEDDIAAAMYDTLKDEKKLLEGAAGVAVAGYKKDSKWREQNICIASVLVACGGNVDVGTIRHVISVQSKKGQ